MSNAASRRRSAPGPAPTASALDVMRTAISALVARDGLAASARNLGVTRESLARVAAGMPVRQGTLEIIARRLYELT